MKSPGKLLIILFCILFHRGITRPVFPTLSEKPDTSVISRFIQLSDSAIEKKSYQKALQYSQHAIALSFKMQNELLLARSFLNAGIAHYELNQLDEALVLFYATQNLYKKNGKNFLLRP